MEKNELQVKRMANNMAVVIFFQSFKNKTCTKIKIRYASRKDMSLDIWN